MTTTLSTHVLDAALGVPAAGLDVVLADGAGSDLATATTDADGRISWAVPIAPGPHTLTAATGSWFAAAGRDTFFPEVTLNVVLGSGHTHVALLLSPFSYTTYKGS
jgi:5-hydroxyisourate hydrolase